MHPVLAKGQIEGGVADLGEHDGANRVVLLEVLEYHLSLTLTGFAVDVWFS